MRRDALDLIRAQAQGLRAACLDAGIPLSMGSSIHGAMGFRAPPLRSGLTLLGVDLDGLSRHIYDDLKPTTERVLKTWEKACALAVLPKYRWSQENLRLQLVDLFSAVFPSVPFPMRSTHDPRIMLGQFLSAVSMHMGRLSTGRTHVALLLPPRVHLAVEQGAVEWKGGRRILKEPIQENLGAPATYEPIGGVNPGHHFTQTLYVNLLDAFPQWSSELLHLMCSAVYLDRGQGIEAQKILTDQFDIYPVSDAPRVPKVITTARALVQSSTRNPYRKVTSLLSPLFGAEEVKRVIGAPQRGYSKDIRDHLLRGIDKLRAEFLVERQADVRDLMKLQDMIR